MRQPARGSTLFPYTTLFRSGMSRADSWATDAHKWLNVPYDSGLAIVADAAPHRASMGLKASYFERGASEERAGMDWVRSEEHTSELQSQSNLVCRLLLEKKK